MAETLLSNLDHSPHPNTLLSVPPLPLPLPGIPHSFWLERVYRSLAPVLLQELPVPDEKCLKKVTGQNLIIH